MGHRRAAAGITLPDVIEAYHVAYREIWMELLGDARESQPPLDSALASVFTSTPTAPGTALTAGRP